MIMLATTYSSHYKGEYVLHVYQVEYCLPGNRRNVYTYRAELYTRKIVRKGCVYPIGAIYKLYMQHTIEHEYMW